MHVAMTRESEGGSEQSPEEAYTGSSGRPSLSIFIATCMECLGPWPARRVARTPMGIVSNRLVNDIDPVYSF